MGLPSPNEHEPRTGQRIMTNGGGNNNEHVLTRRQRRMIKIGNFCLGWAGIIYEAVFAGEVRWPLLVVYTTMAGVPLVMGSDERSKK